MMGKTPADSIRIGNQKRADPGRRNQVSRILFVFVFYCFYSLTVLLLSLYYVSARFFSSFPD